MFLGNLYRLFTRALEMFTQKCGEESDSSEKGNRGTTEKQPFYSLQRIKFKQVLEGPQKTGIGI